MKPLSRILLVVNSECRYGKKGEVGDRDRKVLMTLGLNCVKARQVFTIFGGIGREND